MRKKHRIAQLVQFYTQRSDEAMLKGETYMPQISVESLEAMVHYKYPRLGEVTRRQYAQELYSFLKQNPNKDFLRGPSANPVVIDGPMMHSKGKQGIPLS